MRGDDEGRGAVLDDGKKEWFHRIDIAELANRGSGAAGGVVVVAELLVAERGGATLASGGVDVATAEALLGDLD